MKEIGNQQLIKSIAGFTDHHEQVNEINVHFVQGGPGPPLVLLPG